MTDEGYNIAPTARRYSLDTCRARRYNLYMDNIILIGMPTSGKSTVGVLLAKYIGYDFVDVDLVIQRTNGAVLSELIKEHGAEKFIETEQNCILSLDCRHSVIATGGSAVYGEKAMAHLKTLGKIVYLKTEYKTIAERLKSKDIFSRGVVMKKRGETIKELYDERAPLYEKYADVSIDCTHMEMANTVLEIVNAVK